MCHFIDYIFYISHDSSFIACLVLELAGGGSVINGATRLVKIFILFSEGDLNFLNNDAPKRVKLKIIFIDRILHFLNHPKLALS